MREKTHCVRDIYPLSDVAQYWVRIFADADGDSRKLSYYMWDGTNCCSEIHSCYESDDFVYICYKYILTGAELKENIIDELERFRQVNFKSDIE